MKRVITGLGLCAVLAFQACAGSPTRPDVDTANKVRSIKVRDYKDRTMVVIEGTSRPTYTMFKLSAPNRIVVDLADTQMRTSAKKLAKSPKAMVKSVATRQFGAGRNAVGRVELVLPRHASYASAVLGNRLVIEIPKYRKVVRKVRAKNGAILTQAVEEQPPAESVTEQDLAPAPEAEEPVMEAPAEAPAPEAEAAPADAPPAEEAPAAEAPAAEAPAAEAPPAEAPPAEAPPAEAPAPESLEAPAAEAPVEAPAEAPVETPAEAPAEPAPLEAPLEAPAEAPVEAPAEPAPLEAAPAPAEPAPFTEELPAPAAPEAPPAAEPPPPPLAAPAEPAPMEDEGAEMAKKAIEGGETAPAADEGFVEEVPPAPAPAQAEAPVEAPVEAPLEPAPAPAEPAMVETVPAPEAVPEAAPEPAKAMVSVVDVKVDRQGGITTVTVEADGDIGDYNAFKLEGPTRLVIDIWGAKNGSGKQEVAVDSAGFTALRFGDYPDKVRIVLDSASAALPKYNVSKDGKTLRLELGEKVVAEEPSIAIEQPKAAPETAETGRGKTIRKEVAPQPARSSLSEDKTRKRYTGRRISLDFQGADIRDIIRLIAEVSSLNIITADDVSGTLTIRLINVPWDQALDVILDSQGLGMVRVGNVVRIAPKNRLAEEEKQRLQSLKDSVGLQPLYVKIVPVNYADASELAARVQPVLSERGSVSVDARTNVLIIKDIALNIDDATTLVMNLDTQTPQVLIEAKIVEANTNFTQDLGVQWGGTYQNGPNFGNGTGLTFPNTVGVNGGNQGGAGTPNSPDFAVNLPAAAGPGAGGAVSFLFGSLTNSMVLDLRLSALESAGQGRVISSPRITTLDNRQASIQQGISIPFETTSANGTQTQFIDAVIKLTVTPHITADRSVIMKIKAEKNAPETALRSAGGAPSISKKEATTEVLVKDGETTVIGGIFQITKSENTQGVPFFSKIPIIGWFFQKNTQEDTRSELLVFITPRIVTKKVTVKAEGNE